MWCCDRRGIRRSRSAARTWATSRRARVADIAVFRLEKGSFGFVDMYGARLKGTQKLAAELTLRDGKVVYDLNGITRPDWTRCRATTGRPATRAGMR